MTKLKKLSAPPKLYTVEQFVDQTDETMPFLPATTKKKIWKMIRSGELRAINLGSKKRPIYRIPEDAIAEWWEKHGYNISK